MKSTDGGNSWTVSWVPPAPAVLHQVWTDPTDPALVFAAANVGTYVSADGGAHWTPSGFGGEAAGLAAEAGPRHRLLGDPLLGTSSFPAFPGLWKSSDRGATWAAAGFNTQGIASFAIAGRGPSLFALTLQRDLLGSDDGGRSWTKHVLPADYVNLFASPPEEPDTFYVLGPHIYVPGLEVSLDGGATWAIRPLVANVLSLVPGSPATLFANTRIDTVVGPPGEDGVQRSDDRGATWTTILRVTGGSVTDIGADPADRSRVVVSHLRLVSAEGQSASEVLWTADGGATWSPGVFPPEVRYVFGFVPDPLVPHGFLAGTDAGAFASADGGATWAPLGAGLPRTFARLSLDPSSPHILYAATEGGGIYRLERTEP